MEAIVPYLSFNGDAAAALAFYAKAFDGQVVFQQTFGEAPGECPPGLKDKIMHATFKAGDLTLMASDGPDGFKSMTGTNTSLSLNFPSVESIEKVFKALSEGATISMPLQDTFWGARFGMLTDKFGINWMFNHDYQKKDK